MMNGPVEMLQKLLLIVTYIKLKYFLRGFRTAAKMCSVIFNVTNLDAQLTVHCNVRGEATRKE